MRTTTQKQRLRRMIVLTQAGKEAGAAQNSLMPPVRPGHAARGDARRIVCTFEADIVHLCYCLCGGRSSPSVSDYQETSYG